MERIAHPSSRKEVWLHVDRFDKRNNYVWALQYWNGRKWVYRTAVWVIFVGRGATRFRGNSARQPRGVVLFHDARVNWSDRRVAIVRA